MDPLFELKDKLILVSGGSRGIGKALVRGFAERGAKVVFSSRDEASLESARKDLEEVSSEVFSERCDVSQFQEIEELVNRVHQRHGSIDVLVNVAGVNRRQRAETYVPEDYDFVMDINLKGAFFLSTEVGRAMLQRGIGIQINIESLNSYAPVKGMAPYAMSKFGMVGMTRSLAAEWGPKGIRVNSIAPGFILTDLTRQVWSDPKLQQWGLENTPLRRLGDPKDLVGAAIFLASEASSFMTGQVVRVDGGFSSAILWPVEF